MQLHVTALVAGLLSLSTAQISEPPHNSCLCVTGAEIGLNFRYGPCAEEVLGAANNDDCFHYQNEWENCFLDGSPHDFFHVDFHGLSGWASGNFLRVGNILECPIIEYPTREFRSFFLTTAWNIDWPSSAFISPAAQQAELEEYVDLMRHLNMNAVIFQVRPVGDAFYDSPIEPWSRWLTGTQGTAPSPAWDPLQHLITYAHSFGIEVHPWLNPYRASTSNTPVGLAPNHMAIQFPQYAYPFGTGLWMDPGAQDIIDRVISVVEDIVTRYDVDGLLYDDYFYPYPIEGEEFPDDETYQRYLDGGGQMPRDDWRRDNVNRMIESSYAAIKNLKPHVKFGVSPFGIFRPGHPTGHPQPPIIGLDPYTATFADALTWQRNGWVDYMVPQLYWAEDPPAQRYSVLLDWWIDPDNTNPMGRHVYAANGAYRLSDHLDWPVSELTRQVAISRDPVRRFHESLGNVFFSANAFRDNVKGVTDTFAAQVYPNVATVPEMRWLDVAPASAPTVVVNNKGTVTVTNPERDSVHKYVVYRAHPGGRKFDLNMVMAGDDLTMALEPGRYALKAANRAWVESDPVYFIIG